MGTVGHFSKKVYIKYGHFRCFWEVLFFPIFVTKIEMCLTGSITSENKGGGSDPLRKISITNPFFFVLNASLTFSVKEETQQLDVAA